MAQGEPRRRLKLFWFPADSHTSRPVSGLGKPKPRIRRAAFGGCIQRTGRESRVQKVSGCQLELLGCESVGSERQLAGWSKMLWGVGGLAPIQVGTCLAGWRWTLPLPAFFCLSLSTRRGLRLGSTRFLSTTTPTDRQTV